MMYYRHGRHRQCYFTLPVPIAANKHHGFLKVQQFLLQSNKVVCHMEVNNASRVKVLRRASLNVCNVFPPLSKVLRQKNI